MGFSPITHPNCTATIYRTNMATGVANVVYGPVDAFLGPPIRNAYATEGYDEKRVALRETTSHRIWVQYPSDNSYVPSAGDAVVVTGSLNNQNDGHYTIYEIPRPLNSPFDSIDSSWELRVRTNAPERIGETQNQNPTDDSGTIYFIK